MQEIVFVAFSLESKLEQQTGCSMGSDHQLPTQSKTNIAAQVAAQEGASSKRNGVDYSVQVRRARRSSRLCHPNTHLVLIIWVLWVRSINILKLSTSADILSSLGLFNPSVGGQDRQGGEGRGWSASSGLPGTSDGSSHNFPFFKATLAFIPPELWCENDLLRYDEHPSKRDVKLVNFHISLLSLVRLRMTGCKSFKWDVCVRCHIPIQHISRLIWAVRSDSGFRGSHGTLPTETLLPCASSESRWDD